MLKFTSKIRGDIVTVADNFIQAHLFNLIQQDQYFSQPKC
jgi:hypothetical protein